VSGEGLGGLQAGFPDRQFGIKYIASTEDRIDKTFRLVACIGSQRN